MRKNLLFALIMSTALCLGAQASITVQEQTDAEYLINNGYSEGVAEEVLIVKNRVAGQPCEPLYERKHNKFVRFCQNFYSYLDPSIDNSERFHHDIELSPSYSDL